MTKWLFAIVLSLQAFGILSITSQTQYPLNSRVNEDETIAPHREVKYISDYTIMKAIPRKSGPFFVEGLSFKDENTLVESAGLYKQSSIHYLNANDMSVIKQTKLDPEFFGEGCEIVKNKDGTETVFQLTYREGKVLLWDAETLELKQMIDSPVDIREGWGMTKRVNKETGEVRLYISNGSNMIHIVDPETFKIVKSLKVFDENGEAVTNLNELEFVRGKLWANVFATNYVMVIDPDTGLLDAVIDFSSLQIQAKQEMKKINQSWTPNSVLNGIAYHAETDRLLLTGKFWPLMFEINVQEI